MFVVTVFGLNYSFVAVGLTYSPPVWLAFFRALAGFSGATVLLFAMRTKGHLTTKQKIIALLLGIPGTAMFFGFWSSGGTNVLPGTASVLIYTYPLWIVFLSIPILKERPQPLKIVAALLGFFGVALSAQVGFANMGSDLVAMAELVIAGLSYACLNVFFKKFFNGEQMLKANVWQLAGSLLPLVAWAELSSPFQSINWNFELFAVIIWLGILGTAVTYVIWFRLLSQYKASSLGAYSFLSVVIALTSSALILGEEVNLIQIAGVMTIIVSVYVVNKTEGAKSKQDPE